MITEELLRKKGASCSKCGQAFSSFSDINILDNTSYHGKEVYSAICKNPPYVQRHDQIKEDTLSVVYQSSATGYLEIIVKDLEVIS